MLLIDAGRLSPAPLGSDATILDAELDAAVRARVRRRRARRPHRRGRVRRRGPRRAHRRSGAGGQTVVRALFDLEARPRRQRLRARVPARRGHQARARRRLLRPARGGRRAPARRGRPGAHAPPRRRRRQPVRTPRWRRSPRAGDDRLADARATVAGDVLAGASPRRRSGPRGGRAGARSAARPAARDARRHLPAREGARGPLSATTETSPRTARTATTPSAAWTATGQLRPGREALQERRTARATAPSPRPARPPGIASRRSDVPRRSGPGRISAQPDPQPRDPAHDDARDLQRPVRGDQPQERDAVARPDREPADHPQDAAR